MNVLQWPLFIVLAIAAIMDPLLITNVIKWLLGSVLAIGTIPVLFEIGRAAHRRVYPTTTVAHA